MQVLADVARLGALTRRSIRIGVTMLPATTAVIGILLGFGGLQELFVRGIWNGERQPFLVGAGGAAVAALLLLAALAIWRRWAVWPRLAAFAGALSVVFHVYAALPPARNVGVFAMLSGVGIGVVLLAQALRSRERRPHIVR
jgi:hypothetical protein